MQKIPLEIAIDEIYNVCHSKKVESSPFFFIIGAGISSPIIPQSFEIERECREIAEKRGHNVEDIGNKPIDTYSYWFQRAFPNPKSRQEYLEQKIKGKPISPANLRLAHLLSERKISNLVVTPNFDDMLSRALWLFRINHKVSDHPKTIERIDPLSSEIQIAHVHGSYLFYDCCNLKNEINKRTGNQKSDIASTEALLEKIFTSRIPIVVGYSGWDEDVIMRVLKKTLQKNSHLPYNLYWFCFTEAEIERLPAWLKSHNNATFVIPTLSEFKPLIHDQKILKRIVSKESDVSESKPELPAIRIFESFLRKFECRNPRLIVDPLSVFIKEIKSSLSKDDLSIKKERFGDTEELYFIETIIEKVEKANKLLKKELHNERLKSQYKVEQIINSVRRSRYLETIKKADLIDETKLEIQGQIHLAKALFTALLNLEDHPKEQIIGYNKVIRIISRINSKSKKKNLLIKELIYSLSFKGFILLNMNKQKEAIKIFKIILEKFENSPNKLHRSIVAESLLYVGDALEDLDRDTEAISVYDMLLEKFGTSKSNDIRFTVANALIGKANIFAYLGKKDDSQDSFNEVIHHFERSKSKDLREYVAISYYRRYRSYPFTYKTIEQITDCDKALNILESINDPNLNKRTAQILITKGLLLSTNKQNEDAIKIFDTVLTKIGKSQRPEMRKFIADAILFKGKNYQKLEKFNEAIIEFNKILKKFGNLDDPTLREHIKLAKKGLALCQKKR